MMLSLSAFRLPAFLLAAAPTVLFAGCRATSPTSAESDSISAQSSDPSSTNTAATPPTMQAAASKTASPKNVPETQPSPELVVLESHFVNADLQGNTYQTTAAGDTIYYHRFPRYLVGSIRNNTDHTIKNIEVEISLYDKQGHVVGATSAEITQLASGAKGSFQAGVQIDEATRGEVTCEIKGVTSLSL